MLLEFQMSFRRHFGRIYPRDTGCRRTLAGQGNEPLDRIILPFDQRLDAAVDTIADPSSKAEPTGGLYRPTAVEYALHLSMDRQVPGDSSHQCTRLIQVWPSRLSTLKFLIERTRSDSRLNP